MLQIALQRQGTREMCCRRVDRRGCGGTLGEEGRDRRMAVEISGATLCPSDDLITGARLDRPRTGLVSGPVLEHDWNGRPRTDFHRCGPGCLPDGGTQQLTWPLPPSMQPIMVASAGWQCDWSNMIDIERPWDWDEKAYLRENPNVAEHVRKYPETNGWEHFARFKLIPSAISAPPSFLIMFRAIEKRP